MSQRTILCIEYDNSVNPQKSVLLVKYEPVTIRPKQNNAKIKGQIPTQYEKEDTIEKYRANKNDDNE
jgi:hypothetical protein